MLNLREASGDDAGEGARFEIHFEKARGLTGKALQAFEAHLTIENGVARWSTRSIEDARGDALNGRSRKSCFSCDFPDALS